MYIWDISEERIRVFYKLTKAGKSTNKRIWIINVNLWTIQPTPGAFVFVFENKEAGNSEDYDGWKYPDQKWDL